MNQKKVAFKIFNFFQFSKSAVNSNSRDTSNSSFYTGLLKNRISELEKQLTDKNAIIEFLSAQIISKPPDKTCKDSIDNYRHRSNDNDCLVTKSRRLL